MPDYSPEIMESLIKSQDRFAWEAPLFEYHERTKTWYFVMVLVAIFAIAYSIWTGNFLFAFFVLLMGIMLVLDSNKPPSTTLAQIGDNGIVWNGKLYLFQDLENFAIVYQPPELKLLYIEHTSGLLPRLRIPLEDQNPSEIRDHLKRYLVENLDLRTEHISDMVGRLIRV